MRLTMTLGAFLALVAVMPAAAQRSPSASQIINSLRPRPGASDQLRGIRPSALPPGSPGTAGGSSGALLSSPATPAHAGRENTPSVNLNVLFATNSADLTPAASRTLDELGAALSSATLAPFHFRIVGHTDVPGGADYNRQLSERRAEAVVNYMVTKFHVDRARLDAAGLGSDGPRGAYFSRRTAQQAGSNHQCRRLRSRHCRLHLPG